jgi:hypothetical protein
MVRRFGHFVTTAAFALGVIHCSDDRAKPPPDEKVTENHPGALVVTSPERASFIKEGEHIVVRGTGATKELTVNGKPAKVEVNGEFEADVDAEPGLNVIAAVDGESRVEVPFLYGKFAPALQPIDRAFMIDIGEQALAAELPTASLSSVANAALEKRDLVGMLNGKEFSGSKLSVNWKIKINKGTNGPVTVALAPREKALGVDASVQNVSIDARLTVGFYSRDIRITVDRATVTGGIELGVDDNGALGAAMPDAEAKLDGFKFDAGNAGFPCCVDSILTDFMKPKIEETVRDQLRDQLPKLVSLTLDGVGVPKDLDLSVAKIPTKIPITTRFDGAWLDSTGATLSASALFGGRFAAGTPGADAPGFLTLGQPLDPETHTHGPNLGVTLSLDALNQLLFATWGTGKAAFSIPKPLDAALTPKLPPVISVTEKGALRVALGEVIAQRGGSETPLCAATIRQDVKLAGDNGALLITGDGEPTISITWLADDNNSSGANIVASAAKEQLGKFLKGFRLPLPKIALDKLGGTFAGKSLVVETPSIGLDKQTARVSVSGAMKIAP